VSRPRDHTEWEAAYELTRLFVANQLGPEPADEAGQLAALARASTALEASPLEEARQALRFLAIEYTAWQLAGKRANDEDEDEHGEVWLPQPTAKDWQAAIVAVESANDEDVRLRARGGMSIRASQGGWQIES
jgi:hypothetical protein